MGFGEMNRGEGVDGFWRDEEIGRGLRDEKGGI